MSYILEEAHESEAEDDEYNDMEKKRLKKMRQVQSDSSEEDDEDDDAKIEEENRGFINDDDDEAEGSDSDVEKKRKRDNDDDDDDDLDADNLDDDDLDLIEENIGVKIDRKKKFKRLKRIEDEDSDTEEGDAREKIANEIFEGSGEEDEDDKESHAVPPQAEPYRYGSDEEDEGSEESFIVDDDNRPIQKSKKKPVFEDEGLEAARDIFDCEIDYAEFQKYEDWESRDEDESDEYEDEDDREREPRKLKKDRRKISKRSIYDVFEPSELERGHLTSHDHDVRKTDVPERFQLRQIPVTPTRTEGDDRAHDKELEDEAKWIYHRAFYKPCISHQEARDDAKGRSRRDNQMTEKIYNSLDLIRNSTCEVPFIAFFRKEEVQPELNIHDLWKIYQYDEKWCQLKERKKSFKSLFNKMGEYQGSIVLKDLNAPLPEDLRVIKEEDISSIDDIESSEQFNDIYKNFLLHYGKDQDAMGKYFLEKRKANNVRTKIVKVLKKVRRKKHRKKANIEDDDEEEANKSPSHVEDEDGESEEVETEVEEEVPIEDEEDEDQDSLKKAVRRHEYELLRKCGINSLVQKFGLTPEQFGENLRDSYQRQEVVQVHEEPLKDAENYISKICSTPDRVLEAAVRMMGWQLACEPLVRNTIREVYFERAKISVRPTAKGTKLIDEHHTLYPIKYMKDKPVVDLQGDMFLRIKAGVEEKIITFSLSDTVEGNTSINYLDDMKQLYYCDEFSQEVQDWNDLRGRAVEFAMQKVVADLKRELTQRLLQESKDHVIELCCRKLYNWLKVASYNPGDFSDEDEDDWDLSKGFRVFSVAYSPDMDDAAFGCCIDIDGDCCEIIRLPNIVKRRNSYNQRDVNDKINELSRVREFIMRRKPHAVVVGAESREALMIIADIKDILKELEEQEQFPKINVELLDNELSTIYSVSKKGIADFREYPPLLRQAISLGRLLQDPLIEFSQLCNADDEILNLKLHSLQDQIGNPELLAALTREFVNRTNEVGVDLNTAVAYAHTQNLVQFVCGLGPRKAHSLIKSMKQSNTRLENRNQLVVNYHMGPKVFINCAGFVKIDTNALGDSDNYIEVLDSTRIHPEAYDWARKMAVDALEYDDEEGKPAEALEEILETPERLNELDLEAFAVELNNQGFGKKSITLYDIRHELNHRYKDFRQTFKSPTPEEIFNMLTKETPETFYIGKLVLIKVVDFIHRKPRGEQLDNANPVRNEDTGLWQCPFCLKNDFPELSEVWNHFDAEDCPGQAVGVKGRMDPENGVSGFIHIKNLSDKTVTNPSERVKRHRLIHCRIIKIDPEKFSIELTSRTSDLQDVDKKWRPAKDPFYDFTTESKDSSQEKKKSEKKTTQYHKRVIAHPSFKNIEYNEAEKLMHKMEQGDALIRPSSKGVDRLTITWKVTPNNFCQHIDIREQDKKNDFSLGKKLWIGNEEFEDLDEILARYVAPMAANARQILDYKYFKESFMGNKDRISEYLKEDKKRNPKNIPYLFTSVKILPGKFMLSYLPRVKVIHEYVTVTPEGFKFRNKHNTTLANLLKWFKLNFRNISKTTGAATPGRMTNRTPYIGGATPLLGVDARPLSTPHFGTPFSNYATTPYTPSGQTPFMTPYATPGPSLTPRYGAQTPIHGAQTPIHTSQTPIHAHNYPQGNRAETDWQKAAAAWAQQTASSNRRSHGGGRTPRQDQRAKYDDRRYQYEVTTPKSVRSTPKTINSPSNMSLGGDQTPLYDE